MHTILVALVLVDLDTKLCMLLMVIRRKIGDYLLLGRNIVFGLLRGLFEMPLVRIRLVLIVVGRLGSWVRSVLGEMVIEVMVFLWDWEVRALIVSE